MTGAAYDPAAIPDDPAFALSFKHATGFYYLPTAPAPAKKWRGPYPTEAMMRTAMRTELGDDIAEFKTIVTPSSLTKKNAPDVGRQARLVTADSNIDPMTGANNGIPIRRRDETRNPSM
jgi:hypothetical protein